MTDEHTDNKCRNMYYDILKKCYEGKVQIA